MDKIFKIMFSNLLCTFARIKVLSTSVSDIRCQGNIVNSTTSNVKAVLDPKRRNELIDEAFLEQKDILLDMLETKLKEVRDKKKKGQDRTVNTNELESSKCETMPRNVDVILKANGISAIGDTDVQLRYGENGNGTLSLDATGISNVGKAHVELGVGDGSVHIPGFDNIFTGESFLKKGCNKNKTETSNKSSTISVRNSDQTDFGDVETRRVDRGPTKVNNVLTINEKANNIEKTEHDVHDNSIDNYNKNVSSVLNVSTTIVQHDYSNVDEIVNDTNMSTAP